MAKKPVKIFTPEELEKARQEFFAKWTNYQSVRKIEELAKEGKVRTNEELYHSFVDMLKKMPEYGDDIDADFKHSSNGGIVKTRRILDDLELKTYASRVCEGFKADAYKTAESGLEQIVGGLSKQPLAAALLGIDAPKESGGQADLFMYHQKFQKLNKIYEKLVDVKENSRGKGTLDFTKDPLKGIVSNLVYERMKRVGTPTALKAAESLAYFATVNPAYAEALINEERSIAFNKFQESYDKLSDSDARQYFMNAAQGMQDKERVYQSVYEAMILDANSRRGH